MRDYFSELSKLKLGEQNSETVKACEQIVKEAQRLNNIELEYAAKTAYLKATAFNDEPEKMLAIFPWLLRERDTNPENYNYRELLWSYKWFIMDLPLFPTISKDRILAILKDMETRYIIAGYGIKTVLSYKQVIFQYFGELELAQKYYDEWKLIESGNDLSDCTACIIDQEVSFFLDQGKYAKAIKKAQDVLSYKYSCTHVPNVTYTKIMLSYLYLGELEKSVDLYKKAIEILNINESELDEYGLILTFLGVTQNFVKAKNIFIHQLPFAFTSKCAYYPYEFFLGALIFLKSLLKNGKLEMSLPKEIELGIKHKNQVYQTQDIHDFIEKELHKIAAQFNKRNGNNYYSQSIEKQLELLKFSRKVSL